MKFPLLFALSCFLFSCEQEPVASADPEVEALPACCSEEEALEASAESIYQLDSKWTNDLGQEEPLSSLAGNIQIVTMGYTTCQYACPRLLLDMRAIEDRLPADLREEVRFTFVSIDPEVDTPERLAEYRAENQIDPGHWTLLTGSLDSVQELAVVLGIQYRKTGEKDFAHSNVITVLNSKGEIVHRQEGLSADSAETLKAIAAAH
ncbi:SCO family protein [Verrucomicrobiaceae bacterium 227]